MRRLRKLLVHSVSDYQLLFFTFCLLTAVRFGLWTLSFRNLRQVLWSITQVLHPHTKTSISISKLVWAVEVSSRCMPGGAKCLAKALTTQVLLHTQGYPADLRIGVIKGNQGNLEAHAWIEYQGKVVIGQLTTLSQFTPLPSLQGK